MKTILILIIFTISLFANRFIIKNGDVYDNKTELYWEANPSTYSLTWEKAKKHCTSKGDNWRLPNLYELKSLVDYNKYNPAIATNLIKIKTNDYYWSISEDASDSTGAWIVYFGYGYDNWLNKTSYYYVLCVRE